MKKERLYLLCALLFCSCTLFDDDDSSGEDSGGSDAGADGDADNDADVDADGGPGAGGFEIVSSAMEQWNSFAEAEDGTIYALGHLTREDEAYGPIVGVVAISPTGAEGTPVPVDPGAALFCYDIAVHPAGGLVIAGSKQGADFSNAYVARVESAGGSIDWESEFGTGISNQYNAFQEIVPVESAFHLLGYGAQFYGETTALRTSVDLAGQGGSHTLDNRAGAGDESMYWSGAVSPDGTVAAVGFYIAFGDANRNNSCRIALLSGGATRVANLGGCAGLYGVGWSGDGRLFVFGMVNVDTVTGDADLYMAEINPDDLSAIWERALDLSAQDMVAEGDVSAAGELLLGWKSFENGSMTSYIGKFTDTGEEISVRDFPDREIYDLSFARDGAGVIASGSATPRADGDPYRAWLQRL